MTKVPTPLSQADFASVIWNQSWAIASSQQNEIKFALWCMHERYFLSFWMLEWDWQDKWAVIPKHMGSIEFQLLKVCESMKLIDMLCAVMLRYVRVCDRCMVPIPLRPALELNVLGAPGATSMTSCALGTSQDATKSTNQYKPIDRQKSKFYKAN